MTSTTYLHGSTDEREAARLWTQAELVAPSSLEGWLVPENGLGLDLATGVGAMLFQLQRRYPTVAWTGVDVSTAQLEAAQSRLPDAHFIQADAKALPFPANHFDAVHCSWLLEHVSDPALVVEEVYRILKPGGTCQFLEVDNCSLKIQPELPAVMACFDLLNRLQQASGGDPFVGQRLEHLFRQAGYARVDAHPKPLRGDPSDPVHFASVLEEFAAILESLDEQLPASQKAAFEEAAMQLRSLVHHPGAFITYASVRCRARK